MALSGSNSSSGGAARAARASAVARRTAAAARTRLSSHQLPRPDKRSVVVHRRDAPLDLRHRVRLHLRRPRRVDRLLGGRAGRVEQPQIERQVRHQEELSAEREAGREEEATRYAALADAVEITE